MLEPITSGYHEIRMFVDEQIEQLSAEHEYSNLQHERVDQMTLLIGITFYNSIIPVITHSVIPVLLSIYCMLYIVRTIKRREAGGGILEFSAWLQCLLAM